MSIANNSKIYLSGPLDNCTEDEIWKWRLHAIRLLGGEDKVYDAAKDNNRKGQAKTIEQVNDLVEQDLKELRECAGVLCCPWKLGFGTTMELALAYTYYGKRTATVVDNIELASPWIRYHSEYITTHMDEAVNWLKSKLRWS